jgi:GGDEF domain-containing protein
LAEPARHHSLSMTQVEELIAAVEERVSQLANLFSCELPPGVDYRDILVEAHRRMSKLASEVAGDLLRSASAAPASDAADVDLMADIEELTAAAAEFERVGRVRPTDTERAPETHVAAVPPSSTAVATTAPAPAAVATPVKPTVVGGTLSVELRTQVARALIECRQNRQALSLVLVEIDHFASLARALGPVAAEQRVAVLGQICGGCDLPGASLVHARQACFALVLPDCDRREAVAAADDILHCIRQESEQQAGAAGPSFAVSAGAATVPLPPKNFRVDDLIDSASRCLSTAQLSGGNTLKSIGIY